MSTERNSINEHRTSKKVYLTSFFGGEERGRCLQLTQAGCDRKSEPRTQFISVTEHQALELIRELSDWVADGRLAHDEPETNWLPNLGGEV